MRIVTVTFPFLGLDDRKRERKQFNAYEGITRRGWSKRGFMKNISHNETFLRLKHCLYSKEKRRNDAALEARFKKIHGGKKTLESLFVKYRVYSQK